MFCLDLALRECVFSDETLNRKEQLKVLKGKADADNEDLRGFTHTSSLGLFVQALLLIIRTFNDKT